MNNPSITSVIYSGIRFFLGLYLLFHFVQLIPYGKELFSSEGLFSAALSPLLGYIPNPLLHYDSPVVIMILLSLGAVASVLIMIGRCDRVSSLFIILLLGWLYTRNPLIANPSLPVVGWMLLLHIMLPRGAYGTHGASLDSMSAWVFPKQLWFAAWVLLAVAYSYSGYTKLLSPSWLDGSAIEVVLHNPLSRDYWLNDLLRLLPSWLLQGLTWTIMIIELLFLPLAFWQPTRKLVWLIMMGAQIGFLLSFDFADLTIPMLLFHLLTFDRTWLKKYQHQENATLFYDGTCAFCSGVVRFSLLEDVDKKLHFAPLQGETLQAQKVPTIDDETLIIHTQSGKTYYKSDAVIYLLETLGGLWLVLGKIIAVLPRSLRDFCYDGIGKIRYTLAGKVDKDMCALMPRVYQKRILP